MHVEVEDGLLVAFVEGGAEIRILGLCVFVHEVFDMKSNKTVHKVALLRLMHGILINNIQLLQNFF